jgi:hypothetical protein
LKGHCEINLVVSISTPYRPSGEDKRESSPDIAMSTSSYRHSRLEQHFVRWHTLYLNILGSLLPSRSGRPIFQYQRHEAAERSMIDRRLRQGQVRAKGNVRPYEAIVLLYPRNETCVLSLMSGKRVKPGTVVDRNEAYWPRFSLARCFAMSDILTSLLKLTVVPARFGLIAADAAVTLGKSIVEPEQTGPHVRAARFTDAEIDAAAQIIKANMIAGRDTTFRNLLEINFPDATVRAMAEAALIAARDIHLGATAANGTQH